MSESARIPALVLALVAGLGVVVSSPGASARPASRGPAVPVLDWSDCGDGFECATATVPLDYDHPRGDTISLSLIRLPATDPAHRIGSLFLNPGGPGGSGVEFVREAGPFLFTEEVRAQFDLVGFDPRGIIASTPLICYDTLDDAFEAWFTPFAFPVNRKEERVWAEADRRFAAGCAERSPAILDHMSTADVARDLDLLRRAVGDSKLTYAGYSYGSYLGATYANLFPSKVRALVVDGVLDPVAWSTGRGGESRRLPFSTRLRSDQGAMATLRQFFSLCDAAGAGCAFSDGSPARRFRHLAERLLRNPVDLPDGAGGTFPFGYADLINETLGVLYDVSVWPDFAGFLADLDAFAEEAKPALGRRASAGLERVRDRLRYDDIPYENFAEGFPGVACSDSINPSNLRAWSRAGAQSDRDYGYFGRLWTWITSICLPWPGHSDDRYLGPWRHHTSHPVLVVGNKYDPATRYQGAVILSRLLPDSRLLTLDGWGHTSLFQSSCIDGYVADYLVGGGLPPRGTVCASDVVPFGAAAAARQRPHVGMVEVPPLVLRRGAF